MFDIRVGRIRHLFDTATTIPHSSSFIFFSSLSPLKIPFGIRFETLDEFVDRWLDERDEREEGRTNGGTHCIVFDLQGLRDDFHAVIRFLVQRTGFEFHLKEFLSVRSVRGWWLSKNRTTLVGELRLSRIRGNAKHLERAQIHQQPKKSNAISTNDEKVDELTRWHRWLAVV